MAFRFVVPGEPVAKGRPRFARRGSFVTTFTPEKTVRFEDTVRLTAQAAGVELIPEGPVQVVIEAIWPMRGTPLKKGRRPSCWKVTRPDAENVSKAILDALNGLAWADDSQVVMLGVKKLHAAQGEPARTVVTIRKVEGEPN